jgi:ABC-type antimicrobial peptide transport system permease subunit
MLQGLAAAVLLTSCLNLANMMLAFGTARQKEIAIRMALGARPAAVRHDLLGRALLLSAAGIALGGAAAWLLGSYLESFLFGISARDPLAFGVSALVLILTALAASYLPARRASMADPWSTLRSE